MQSKQNKQFCDKSKNNSTMANKMKQTSLKFMQLEQLAYYSQSQDSYKSMIISIKSQNEERWACNYEDRVNIQIIIGLSQPQGKKSIQKILLSIVKYIPRPSKNYSVIYINTLANNNAYKDFKNILEFLPEEYFSYLDRIYVLNANFKDKASYWISFDYLTNYIKNKTIHFATIKDLIDKLKLSQDKIMEILPEPIISQLAKKQDIAKKYIEGRKAKEDIIYNTNIYSVEKEEYLENTNGKMPKSSLKVSNLIQSYQVGQTGAPLILQLLLSYFNGKQQLLDSEGLFRKSVDIDKQTQLLKELSKGNYDCLEEVSDPHMIANAIKKFLAKLDQPIFPFKDFNNFMEINQNDFKQKLVNMVNKMASNRKMALLLLIDFLKEKLLPRTTLNKMTENNLSIVFAPCLMRSQVPSAKDLIFTKKSISLTLVLFKQFEHIFGNKKQRSNTIRKSIKIKQRQTLRQRLSNHQEQIGKDVIKIFQNTENITETQKEQDLNKQISQNNKTELQTNILLSNIFMMGNDIKQSSKLQQEQFWQPLLICSRQDNYQE